MSTSMSVSHSTGASTNSSLHPSPPQQRRELVSPNVLKALPVQAAVLESESNSLDNTANSINPLDLPLLEEHQDSITSNLSSNRHPHLREGAIAREASSSSSSSVKSPAFVGPGPTAGRAPRFPARLLPEGSDTASGIPSPADRTLSGPEHHAAPGSRGHPTGTATPRPAEDLDLIALKHLIAQTVHKVDQLLPIITPMQVPAASGSKKDHEDIEIMTTHYTMMDSTEFQQSLVNRPADEVRTVCSHLYDIVHYFRTIANVPLPSSLHSQSASGSTLAVPLSSSTGQVSDGFTPRTLNTQTYRRKLPAGPPPASASPADKDRGVTVLSPQLTSLSAIPVSGSARYLLADLPEHKEDPILSYCSSLASMGRRSITEIQVLTKEGDDAGFGSINNYIIVDELGRGNFGKVFLASNTVDNTLVAIKRMDCGLKAPKHRFGGPAILTEKDSGLTSRVASLQHIPVDHSRSRKCSVALPDNMVMREIAIMKKLSHKNIVQLLEVIHDDEDECVYLVMQYVDKGPIGRMHEGYECDRISDPVNYKSYFRQAATGLEFLHQRNILHRDIKPENILVSSEGLCCLADFGVSAVVKDGDVVDFAAGTQAFFSPEMCRGEGNEVSRYGKQSDVWALGVTFYALRFGVLPFHDSNFMKLANKIIHEPLQFPPDCDPEDPVREVLSAMLTKNPEHRISLSKLRRHKFFEGLSMSQSLASSQGFLGAFPREDSQPQPSSPIKPPEAAVKSPLKELSVSFKDIPPQPTAVADRSSLFSQPPATDGLTDNSVEIPISDAEVQNAIKQCRRHTLIQRIAAGGAGRSFGGRAIVGTLPNNFSDYDFSLQVSRKTSLTDQPAVILEAQSSADFGAGDVLERDIEEAGMSPYKLAKYRKQQPPSGGAGGTAPRPTVGSNSPQPPSQPIN